MRVLVFKSSVPPGHCTAWGQQHRRRRCAEERQNEGTCSRRGCTVIATDDAIPSLPEDGMMVSEQN